MNNHFAILLFCYFAILLQLPLLHIPSILTFHPSLPPSKKFSPFPLSYRKYIVTLPHGGLRHEEQAILMRTILQ